VGSGDFIGGRDGALPERVSPEPGLESGLDLREIEADHASNLEKGDDTKKPPVIDGALRNQKRFGELLLIEVKRFNESRHRDRRLARARSSETCFRHGNSSKVDFAKRVLEPNPVRTLSKTGSYKLEEAREATDHEKL
jgi:hypothetical protein